MKKKRCVYKSKKIWWKTSLDTGWPTNKNGTVEFQTFRTLLYSNNHIQFLYSTCSTDHLLFFFFFLLYQEHASNLVETFFI